MRLIDADALYEKTANWEAQALHMVEVTMYDEDKTEEWRKWSAVLTERSAFKYDIADAPTIDAVEVKHGEWVSVKDRLPEDGQEVLVYAVGKADGFIGDNVIALSERFMFRLFPAWNGVGQWKSPWEYFDSNYEITHWMPLPEPPKGAEQ